MIAEAFENESGHKSPLAVVIDKIFAMADLKDDHTLEVPRNIHLNEKHNSLVIEYSWFKLKYLLLLFVVPVCSYIIVQSDHIEGSVQNITIPIAIIMLFNVVIIYYCLTRLINTTLISVNPQRIKIRHKPLPLMKGTTVMRSDLIQLYVTRQMRTKRYNFYAATFQINAILSDKHVITIVSGLSDPTQGRFIEQKIEQFLGITDIYVDDEIEKH